MMMTSIMINLNSHADNYIEVPEYSQYMVCLYHSDSRNKF